MADVARSVPATGRVEETVVESRRAALPRRPQLSFPIIKILIYTLLTLGAFLFAMPFLWMITTSLMTQGEIIRGEYVPHSRLYRFSAVSEEDWNRPLREFLPPTADIDFSGNSIMVYYHAHPQGAVFDVLIDGQLVTSVDSYSPQFQRDQTVVIDSYPTVPTLSLTQQVKLADTNHTLSLVLKEQGQRRTIWYDRAVARNENGEETTIYASEFDLRLGRWETLQYDAGRDVWDPAPEGELAARATHIGFPAYLENCCRATVARSTRLQNQHLSEYIRLETITGTHSNLTTDFLPLGLNKLLGLNHRYIVTGSFSHYVKVWTDSNFGEAFINSVTLVLLTVTFQVLFAIMAAYAFARMQFPGRDLVFFAFLATLFVPFMVTVVPNLLTVTSFDKWSQANIGPILSDVGDFTGTIPFFGKPKAEWARWLNNWPALVVPFWASTFGIFLLRQFFMQIPNDLWDAAQIDGAGHLRFLFQIVVPISKAAITTVALFSFIGTWDQLEWPILVTNTDEWRPIAYSLYEFRSQEADNPQLLMAGALIALLPVIIAYLIAQRQFTEGIATTGLKG